MTVLMTDATNMLSHDAKTAYAKGELEDILFVEDTLLISKRAPHLEEYFTAVEE